MSEVITDEMIQKVLKGSLQMSEGKAIAMAEELYNRQMYRPAEKVCRQIIAHNPTLADAHNILGISLSALGKPKEAVASLRRTTKLAPKIARYHANLGEILRISGNLPEASVALIEAIRIDPNDPKAHNNLGIVRYERKEYGEAIKCYRRAIELDPKFAEAYNNLGNSLRMSGDTGEAMEAYQNALLHRAIYPEAYNNLGTLLQDFQKTDQAIHALRKAIAQNPRYVEAYANLAAVYHNEKKDIDALRELNEALKIAPRNPRSLLLTARIQLGRNNTQAAEQACKIVLADNPSNAEALTILGQVLHEIDRYDESVKVLENALKVDPKNAEALNFYGVALKSVGRLDESREQILAAIELSPNMYGAYANLNDLLDFSKEKELFERVEAIMESAQNESSAQLLPLHFAYGKALDDNGRYEEALEHYIEGGRMKRAQLNYDEAATLKFFDDIKEAFPAEIFKNRPFEGNPTDRLVFIVGMPRSGSTLTEQIISSHSDVFGAGEVKFLSRALNGLRDRFPSLSMFPEMISEMTPGQYGMVATNYISDVTAMAGSAKKVTDKMLTNYFFVGLINLLYPKAKIINTVRNPIDTCLSAFTKLFKDDLPHSYDLGELGRYYRRYEDLMKHWQEVLPEGVLKVVSYEDVVNDTEKVARDLIEFLDLEWDPECLKFHESSRPVKTASVAQIRKPIYKTAVERWKRYGAGLQPLVDAIAVAEIPASTPPAPGTRGRSKKAFAKPEFGG